jgi:hypothetical protein
MGDSFACPAQAQPQTCGLAARQSVAFDIDQAKLPSVAAVSGLSSEQFTSALSHDQGNRAFNPHLRLLLHVGFSVVANMGRRYLDQLEVCEGTIARNVTPVCSIGTSTPCSSKRPART